MDLYVGLGDQRHAVRLLQLFYLQHSREGAMFPTYGDEEDGAAAATPKGGGSRGGGRRRRRRPPPGENGDDANHPHPRQQGPSAGYGGKARRRDDGGEHDARAAADPFYRMVGDSAALDGRVRIFPGVEEEEETTTRGADGGVTGNTPRRRLVFARAAVEMGPCTNRHGPASLYISGVTVPPLAVIAWLKRSFVGRHVQRAFFIPRPPNAEQQQQAKQQPPPSACCCWGGIARTADLAAAAGWARAAQVAGLDGVRVACSDRRLQAEVLAALEREGKGGKSGAEEEDEREDGDGGKSDNNNLRLEPTAAATHALCVARVSVADLRASGTSLFSPSEDDGAQDPSLVERAALRRKEMCARRGMVGAAEAAAAAALEEPHRYVWSVGPVAWLYRLAWDEPATHGGAAGGGGEQGAAAATGGGSSKANAAACAHAVHKLDEALRVLGLASDGTDAADGRAARADVTPEERAALKAWDEASEAAAASTAAGGAERASAPHQLLRLRRALDVGAAPGSWTALMARRILAEQSRREETGEAAAEAAAAAAPVVVAVDPADLDPSCLELPIVRHLRVRAGTDEAARQIREALAVAPSSAAAATAAGAPSTSPPPPPPQVDLLTCDANTHPIVTLEKLIIPLLPHLRPGGWLVVTLKLHGSGRLRGGVSSDCARLLSEGQQDKGGGAMLPGCALWLMANTNHERTYVARKREDWVD